MLSSNVSLTKSRAWGHRSIIIYGAVKDATAYFSQFIFFRFHNLFDISDKLCAFWNVELLCQLLPLVFDEHFERNGAPRFRIARLISTASSRPNHR